MCLAAAQRLCAMAEMLRTDLLRPDPMGTPVIRAIRHGAGHALVTSRVKERDGVAWIVVRYS
jgi:hypothetical protein